MAGKMAFKNAGPGGGKPLHLVLLNQFYPPDRSPTARYLRDLAEAMASRGHTVEVYCSRALYRAGGGDRADSGVRVRRFWAPNGRGLSSKALGYAAYYAQAGAALAQGPAPDLILALSSPPFLGLLARLFGKRHAHWVMDAYPQALFASGAVRRGGLASRLLSALARSQYRGAAGVITLGPDMARRLRPELGRPALVRPLWLPSDLPPAPPEAAVRAVRRAWGAAAGRRVLLYAGNLGRGHRYGEFVDAMRAQGGGGPLWVFMGDGVGFNALRRIRAAEPGLPLRMEGPCFGADYAARLAAADAHLVSLQEGWQGLIVPSKLQASLASAKPVIFVGPADCEPARWIAASGAGWVVPPGDGQGLIRALAAPKAERLSRGRRGRVWALGHFGAPASLKRMALDLEGFSSAGPSAAHGGRQRP